MSYLNNVWYCAALSSEISTTPMRRVICDLPIALFRTESGRAAAVEDRCSHRQAPLSMGLVIGEEIQCNYHGFVFDCRGTCTHIPHQISAPRSANIRAFTLVERWGYVWMWWGEQSLADPSLIPDCPWVESDEYRTVHFYFYVKANHQLMADNLLDVSHIDFLHRHGIGSKAGARGDTPQVKLESSVEGDKVHFFRTMFGAPLGGVAQKWINSKLPADRSTRQMWEKPNTIHFVTTFENEENKIQFRMEHIMTPETASTTHYFMNWTRNFGLDNVNYPTDEDVRREQTGVVSGEDIPMVEAQQKNIEEFGSDFDVAAKSDQFVGNVHRKLQELFVQQGLPFPPEVVRTVRHRPVQVRSQA